MPNKEALVANNIPTSTDRQLVAAATDETLRALVRLDTTLGPLAQSELELRAANLTFQEDVSVMAAADELLARVEEFDALIAREQALDRAFDGPRILDSIS